MTAKDRVSEWVLNHMDGQTYKVRDIGHWTKVNAMNVRRIIKELCREGIISAKKVGGGQHTEWHFGPADGQESDPVKGKLYPERNSTEDRVLTAICDYQLEHEGKTPTIREIQAMADIKSTSTVAYHVTKLINRGLIKKGRLDYSRIAQVAGGMFQVPNQILERRTLESYSYIMTDVYSTWQKLSTKYPGTKIEWEDRFEGVIEKLVFAIVEYTEAALVSNNKDLKMIANALGMGVFDHDKID